MSSRIKAFLIHLLISALLAALVLFLVFFIWYPAPLDEALGVTNIFLILMIIDVVIGPACTLLVYKPEKRDLLADLMIIVALQLGALGFGLWTIAEGRPVWLVFNIDRFDVVSAVDIDDRHLSDASPEYQTPSWSGPRWVRANPPADVELRSRILLEATLGGADIAQRPNLYAQLDTLSETIRKRALPLDKLNEFNDQAAVRNALEKWPLASAWVPLMARARPMVVLLDDDRTKPVSIVDLRPWN